MSASLFIRRQRLPHCLLALFVACYFPVALADEPPPPVVPVCGAQFWDLTTVPYGDTAVDFMPDNLLLTADNNMPDGHVIYQRVFPVKFVCKADTTKAPTAPFLSINNGLFMSLNTALSQSGVALQYSINGDSGPWYNYGFQGPLELSKQPYKFIGSSFYNKNKYVISGSFGSAVGSGPVMQLGIRLIRKYNRPVNPKPVSDFVAGMTNATLFYISPTGSIGSNAMGISLAGSVHFHVAHCAATVSFNKPSLDFGVMTSKALENGKAAVPFAITLHKTASCEGQTYDTNYDIPRIFVTFTSDQPTNRQGNITLTDDSGQSTTQSPLNLQLSIHRLNISGTTVPFNQQVKFEQDGDSSIGAASMSKTVNYTAVVQRENASLPVQPGEFDTLIIATFTYY